MSQYTKGEWKIGCYIVYADIKGVEYTPLICNTNIGIIPEPEKTANAHLIAASPMMYEALRKVSELELGYLNSVVEEVLAKAEGKEMVKDEV